MNAPPPANSPRRPLPLSLCLFVPLSLLTLAACSSDPTRGYSFQPARAAHVHTVAVPVFENQTLTHDLEVQLTEAIIKQIQNTTPWRVVSGDAAGAADTTLSGTITESQLHALSHDSATGLVQEMSLAVTVDFDWRDNRSQKLLVSRRSFTASGTFVPARGSQERIEIGEYGAVQELARDIVSELRSTW